MKNINKPIVYIIALTAFFQAGYTQSVQDLQRLRAEYEKLQKTRQPIPLPAGADLETGVGLPREVTLIPGKLEIAEEDTARLKHFGYNFFTRRDTLPFWENLPAPANYLLGPGDEVVISLWGETQLHNTYTITRDGKIYVDKVGLLYLTGKTLGEGRNYLRSQFERVYSTLKGKTPTTFMDVSLGELKSINVNFVGEVSLPGVHPVHPFSTVITGLIQAGGVDTTGSLRSIRIRRNGEIFAEVDLYGYLLKGEIPEKIQLRDQDIVIIPVRNSTITVDGEVFRPGKYEALNHESLAEILGHAGGVKQTASTTVELKRIKNIEDRNPSGETVEQKYVELENVSLIPARDGDMLTVHKIFPFTREVYIYGQVKRPGVYAYVDSMTFLDLLRLGGGYEDTTFWQTVHQDRAEIIRRDENSRYNEVIEVPLNDLVKEKDTIYLRNLDQIIIHENTNFFEPQNVQILGEVNVPGTYPLIKDGETLQSILNRAGGLTPRAFEDGIEINRDSLKVVWEDYSVPIMAGDSIVVSEKPGVVFVTGEVYNPGLIAFKKGRSLNSYLEAAGGVTIDGDKGNVLVVYANGDVKLKKFLSAPEIRDGVMIVVNVKKPKIPFDGTRFATNMIQILSSLITIAILLTQI